MWRSVRAPEWPLRVYRGLIWRVWLWARGRYYLRPGTFIRRGEVWLHADAPLPNGLEPKADRPGIKNWMWPIGKRPLLSLIGPVRRFTAPPNARGGYEAVLDKGGSVLAIDPPGGRTCRAGRDLIFSETYETTRQKLQQHVRGPKFHIPRDRRSLHEEWVAGVPLRQVPPESAIRVARQLLEGYEGLIRSASWSVPFSEYYRALVEAVPDQEVKELIESAVSSSGVLNALDRVALIPSHGEAGWHNIVVHRSGAVLIDWETKTVGWKPFWVDVLSVAGAPNGEMWRKGYFESVLSQVWSAGGGEYSAFSSRLDRIRALKMLSHVARRTTTVEKEDDSISVQAIEGSGLPRLWNQDQRRRVRDRVKRLA